MLGPDLRGMAVDVADERLLTVVDDLHGTIGVEGEQRAVDLHRQVLTAAERAADAGEMDTHLLGLQVRAGSGLVAIDVEPLRRDVDVDAALAVGYRVSISGPRNAWSWIPTSYAPNTWWIRAVPRPRGARSRANQKAPSRLP